MKMKDEKNYLRFARRVSTLEPPFILVLLMVCGNDVVVLIPYT
jgi:hypothetical protein